MSKFILILGAFIWLTAGRASAQNTCSEIFQEGIKSLSIPLNNVHVNFNDRASVMSELLLMAKTWEKMSSGQKNVAQFEFVARQAIFILGKMRAEGPTKRYTAHKRTGFYRYQVSYEEPMSRSDFDIRLTRLSRYVHHHISQGQFTLERNLTFILDATALLSSEPTNFIDEGLGRDKTYQKIKDKMIVGVTAPLEMSDFNSMLGTQLVPIGVIFKLMKYDGSEDDGTPYRFALHDLSHGERALPTSENANWKSYRSYLNRSSEKHRFEFQTALFNVSHEQDLPFAQEFVNTALSATTRKQLDHAFVEFLRPSNMDSLGARLSRPNDMGMEMPVDFSAVDVVRKGYASLYRSFAEFHGWKPNEKISTIALEMNVRTTFAPVR